MDKKNLIQLIVVGVAFLASGLILYNSFFKSASPLATSAPAAGVASATPASVLPYGSNFDYQQIDNLQKQGFEFGQIQYPVVSTSTEVGKTTADLIIPLPGPSASK